MLSYRYGALEVVETGREPREINEALQRLDPRLFVELQVDLDQQRVWTVQLDIGDAGPPVPVLDWRDDDGDVIPELTWNVVGEIERMMQRGPIDNEKIREKNDALRARRREEAREEVRELVFEHLKVLKSKHFTMGLGGGLNHSRHREREARLLLSDRGL